MQKTILVILAVLILFCVMPSSVMAFPFIIWNSHSEEQKTAEAHAFIDIFQYIAANEDREFDYVTAAKELKLSEDDLVSCLFALERAGKIKVTPKYLPRKPIVITHNDRQWYFHRVTLPHTIVPKPRKPL